MKSLYCTKDAAGDALLGCMRSTLRHGTRPAGLQGRMEILEIEKFHGILTRINEKDSRGAFGHHVEIRKERKAAVRTLKELGWWMDTTGLDKMEAGILQFGIDAQNHQLAMVAIDYFVRLGDRASIAIISRAQNFSPETRKMLDLEVLRQQEHAREISADLEHHAMYFNQFGHRFRARDGWWAKNNQFGPIKPEVGAYLYDENMRMLTEAETLVLGQTPTERAMSNLGWMTQTSAFGFLSIGLAMEEPVIIWDRLSESFVRAEPAQMEPDKAGLHTFDRPGGLRQKSIAVCFDLLLQLKEYEMFAEAKLEQLQNMAVNHEITSFIAYSLSGLTINSVDKNGGHMDLIEIH